MAPYTGSKPRGKADAYACSPFWVRGTLTVLGRVAR